MEILSLLRSRSGKKRRMVVGLKSDNSSREMLLRLLTSFVKPGDDVLAVHVLEPHDTFDPNTFHIHEDLCRSKLVDFLVKVSVADSYVSELANQVRDNCATILTIGCSTPRPKDSAVAGCLNRLPPTCTLLVVDNRAKILIQKQGTSQQGAQSSRSSLKKSITIHCTSATSSERQVAVKKRVQVPEFMPPKVPVTLGDRESKALVKHFTKQELVLATNNFCTTMVIGEGGHSKVYRAVLKDGQAAAVKVLRTTLWSEEDLVREVEMLSNVKHKNIIRMIGYCCNREMHAVVYILLKGSLKQNLRRLGWSERMSVAIGAAKALEYLHHNCNPPIIHRDVKSSNILLTEICQPQLSDFGSAIIHHQTQQPSGNTKPFNVVGTFGYLAPEYLMFGKVDEKIDVYSFGVVLLELITGKEAIQTNQANQESLVLWAKSLLCCDLCERLIDPHLKENYKKKEMEILMIAARLCLMQSSSRRPTMKMILKLLEEPEYYINTQKDKDDLLNGWTTFEVETGEWRHDFSASYESIDIDDI